MINADLAKEDVIYLVNLLTDRADSLRWENFLGATKERMSCLTIREKLNKQLQDINKQMEPCPLVDFFTLKNDNAHPVEQLEEETMNATPQSMKIVDFFTLKNDNAHPVEQHEEETMNATPQSMKIEHFIHMFGNSDATFSLAKHFAELMAETSALMCEDDPSLNLPTNDALRMMTVDYAKDMVADFEACLMEAINELFEKAEIVSQSKEIMSEARREVKISINM